MKLTDLRQLIQEVSERFKPHSPNPLKGEGARLSIQMDKNNTLGAHTSRHSLQPGPQRLPVSFDSRLFQKTMLAPATSEPSSSLSAWNPGPGKTHKDTTRGVPAAPRPAAPGPSLSQACTHKFLRSVAPRKAFLGRAWMAFSLRSL